MKLWERDMTEIRQVRGKSIYGGAELPRKCNRFFFQDIGQRDDGNQHCKSEWVVCVSTPASCRGWWSGRGREGPKHSHEAGPSHKLAVCL